MTSFSVRTLVSPAFNVPISSDLGHAFSSLYRLIALPSKSKTMIAPPLRASPIFPKWLSLVHFSKLWSPVRPRVSVISPALRRPGSFLMTYLPSGVFCLSSMTSCSILRPETSWICLMTTPSTSRPKEWPTELSRSGSGMPAYSLPEVLLLVDQAGAAGELGEPEDNELRGLHRRHPDLADHLTGVDALGGVRLAVALAVERLVRSEPEQRALAPLVAEERADRAPDAGPERIVVRLEDDPLRPVEDRLLEVVEQPPDVQVAPFRLGRERACAPHPDAAARERPDAVDAGGVEQVVLALGELGGEPDRAADDLVRRRLVHAARVVIARPHSRHVPARRHRPVAARERVEHVDPRVVEGGVLRVVVGAVGAPLLDLLGPEPGRRVEDGHPIAHQRAVVDHRGLDRLHAVEVDGPGLVGAHQVGHHDHRDLVDGLQPGEAGAVGDVADVVVGGDAGRCRRRRGPEGDAAGIRGRQRAVVDRLDPDQLRGLRRRDDVALPAARGDVGVGLLDLVAPLHDEGERVVRRRRLPLPRRRGGLDLPGQLALAVARPGLEDAVAAHRRLPRRGGVLGLAV